MKHLCRTASVGALCLLTLACSAREQPIHDNSAPPRDLSGILAPIRERAGLPALGGAILTSHGLEAIGVSGVRSAAADVPVSVEDRWHIGSCGKAITATLVARLVDKGVLKWETTIGEVLGPEIDLGWRDVTIAQLLSHRGGLSMNLSEELWQEMAQRGGSPRQQRRFFVTEGLKRFAPTTRPDTQTIYSNAGYIVAGVMLEMLTDEPFEELVRTEVFEPLGMSQSGFGAPGNPGALDQPLGHTRGESGFVPVAVNERADNPAAAGPAGTMHVSLGDWARFVAAHLRGERGDESFLKRESWRRLHTPGSDDWGYVAGWVVAEADWAGRRLLRHVGSNNFWIAEVSMAPQKDFAVLIVTNMSHDSAELPFQQALAALVADHEAHAR